MSETDSPAEPLAQSLNLIAKVEQALHHLPKTNHILVAYSGGLDSTVLLHALASHFSASKIRIQVLHVHHGVSANADLWVEHCRGQAQSLGLEYDVEYASLDGKGSFEYVARNARYDIFRRYMSKGSLLLMAHHADDQAETVLMRILRQGHESLYEGIPQQRSFAGGLICRPFLNLSRQELLSIARTWGLSWVEDESNRDTKIERNRLRHEVLPRLRVKESDIDSRLRVMASSHARVNLCRERMFAVVFARLRDSFLLQCAHFSSAPLSSLSMDWGLNLDVLQKLDSEFQKACLRDWIKFRALPQPNAAVFDRIWSELLPARPDADPEVRWGSICLRRVRKVLYLIDIKKLISVPLLLSAPTLLSLSGGAAAKLDDGLLLSHIKPESDEALPLMLAGDGLSAAYLVSYGGLNNSIRVFGKSKKKWLKEAPIPSWRRGALLCLVHGDTQAEGGVVEQVLDLQSFTQLAPNSENAVASEEVLWLCRQKS